MINSNIIFWERDAFKIQSLMLTKYGTKNKMQTHRCTDACMCGQDRTWQTQVKIFGPYALFRFDSGLADLGWDHTLTPEIFF